MHSAVLFAFVGVALGALGIIAIAVYFLALAAVALATALFGRNK